MRGGDSTLLLLTLATSAGAVFVFSLGDSKVIPEGSASYFLALALVAWLVVEAVRNQPPFNVTTVLLSSCLLFFCSAHIFSTDPLRAIAEVDGIVTERLSYAELDTASIAVLASLSISLATVGVLRLITTEAPPPHRHGDPAEDEFLAKLGLFAVLVSLPFAAFAEWRQFIFARAEGFEAVYASGGSSTFGGKLATFLFTTGFMLVVTFERSRRRYLVAAALFCAVALLAAAKGVRGAVLTAVIFSVWHYRSRWQLEIPLFATVVATSLMLAIFVVITVTRSGASVSTFEDTSVVDVVAGQGRSLQVIALYNRVADDVAAYGRFTVFSNLVMPLNVLLHPELRIPGQTIYQVLYSNNMKFILTYVLDEQYYLAGGGVGSSFVLELLESGQILFAGLSLVLGGFLFFFPRFESFPLFRFLSLHLLTWLIYLPRGDFFPNMLIIGRFALVFAALRLLLWLRRRTAPLSITALRT